MHPFRAAVEARDLDAMMATMRDDVEFRSPAVFKPYRGKESVEPILRAVLQVFEGFHYVSELEDGAGRHALEFRAEVAGRQVDGCDFLRSDDDGMVTELMVMIRPLSALVAVAETMGKALESA